MSQTSVPNSKSEGPSTDSSTPTATLPLGTGTSTNDAAALGIDSTQEASQGKFISSPGFSMIRPSFSYMNANAPSGSPQQSAPGPGLLPDVPNSLNPFQSSVPGQSMSVAPSFSYNIIPANAGFSSGQQFRSSTEAGAVSSVSAVSQTVFQPSQMSSTLSTAVFTTNNMVASAVWVPPALPFQAPPGIPRTPITPGPPGITPVMPSSVDKSAPSSSGDITPARLVVPSAPILSNPHIQLQPYAHFPSVSPMAANPQGPWLQPPLVGGMLRPPFAPYPANLAGPYPMQHRPMVLHSVPQTDTQPPGVAPMPSPAVTATSTSVSATQLTTASEMPPSNDINKNINGVNVKDEASTNVEIEAWTAHRTETGVVYYYNALTGESTYQKPAGFKEEVQTNNVTAQPTPISMEALSGTDWALVTTNDGKKYYCNAKTKVSSWQIPAEVVELKKKHDADSLKTQSASVTNTNAISEESYPITLSAPALDTGGRDATALRTSVVPGPSSALDLVKKKLQDSGSPASVSRGPSLSGTVASTQNGTKVVESTVKGSQKERDANDDSHLSESSSDSDDEDSGLSKEELIIQFKEMLKERGVAPFSKWEKELPKIVFDPRFKAVPSYSARKALFEHYVRTRADEERKEKRAAQKAAVERFKQLLEEAKEDINQNTDYEKFKKKWGHDPRFEALERKEREVLLNERVLPLKRAAEEKVQAARMAAISSFKSMLQDRSDITANSRWSKVKESLRSDPRYKSVKHEDREALFNEYVSGLKALEEESNRLDKIKQDEEEKLKERERMMRKRKEREEQEVERVRMKARRKEAVESYQALLVETIKDPQASWTDSKRKLDKDPQGRASNSHLDEADLEKLFREHVKILHERCVQEFRALLAEVITSEAAGRETEDGKTVLTSWSTAKQLLKADSRCAKIPRKDRESLWRRHVEEIQRRQKLSSNQEAEKLVEARVKSSFDSGKYSSGSRRTRDK